MSIRRLYLIGGDGGGIFVPIEYILVVFSIVVFLSTVISFMQRSFLFNSWFRHVKFSRYRMEDNQCFLNGIEWM